jgi:hypothetical protein
MSNEELARIGYEAAAIEWRKLYPNSLDMFRAWPALEEETRRWWGAAAAAISKQIALDTGRG